MEGALIADNDIIIVLQQEDAEDGQVVVALVNDGDEVTVKRLRKRKGVAYLESDWIDGRRDEVPLNGGRVLGRVIHIRRDMR